MSKGMKITRYITTFAALLFFIAYILKITGVGFFKSLGDWVLLPFWVLIAINMIILIRVQRPSKSNEEK